MKTLSLIVVAAFAAPIFLSSLCAQPAGKGPNSGGRGAGKGGMPEDFRGVIHSLFAEHEQVERSVELTRKGYRAVTTSKNPEIAAMLRKHVAQMESRLEGGMGVRHWDPAFAEMREHYGDLVTRIKKVDGGVAVSVKGKTPAAIAVAKNHAKIISGFVEKGEEQMHARHAAVVEGSEGGELAAAGGCGKGGGGACGKGKGKGGDENCGDEECGKGEKPCCAARAGKENAKAEGAPES